MEMTPGYKQTEVGVIPEEWDSEPCSKLCVKIQDGTHFSPTIRGNDYLYLTSKNVRFGYLDVSTADRIDAAQHEAIYKRCDVKYGDLLLTKDGANTGNAALNTLTEQFSLLSSVALLRFDPKQHSAAYFLQQFLSEQGQQRMKDAMSGNAITRLTLEKIRKLRFPVASLPEQRAIATALSDVDGLLGGLERLIAKKRDLKQAAGQQLLTGQTRLPGFSGIWKETTLGEIGECTIGLTYEPENVVKHGLLVLRSSNIQDGHLEYSDNVYVNMSIPDHLYTRAGDILICVRNGSRALIGKCAQIDQASAGVTFGAFMSVYRTKHWRFVFHAFQGESIQRQIRDNIGATINQITNKDLKSFCVKLPPADEQSAIATVLSDMGAEIEALEQRLAKTRALKQGMMQELLTGKTRLVSREDLAHA
jgi:type I restriction enzyme S subunit